jgi:hypothetical protein
MVDSIISLIILFITSLKKFISYFVFRPPKISSNIFFNTNTLAYKTEITKVDNKTEEV